MQNIFKKSIQFLTYHSGAVPFPAGPSHISAARAEHLRAFALYDILYYNEPIDPALLFKE